MNNSIGTRQHFITDMKRECTKLFVGKHILCLCTTKAKYKGTMTHGMPHLPRARSSAFINSLLLGHNIMVDFPTEYFSPLPEPGEWTHEPARLLLISIV